MKKGENRESYNDIFARFIQMKKEYKSLSAEQRNSDGGKELLKKIEEDRQTLRNMEAEIGILHCDGNYPNTSKTMIKNR